LEYILGKVSEIMHWETDRSRDEFAWLGLMAKIKYDGDEDFRAGVRFVESLADWLQQFPQAEREVAYGFVRRHLGACPRIGVQNPQTLAIKELVSVKPN